MLDEFQTEETEGVPLGIGLVDSDRDGPDNVPFAIRFHFTCVCILKFTISGCINTVYSYVSWA